MAVINQVVTEKYAIYNGDSAEVLGSMPDGSIDFSIYSPPFAQPGGGVGDQLRRRVLAVGGGGVVVQIGDKS